MGELTIGVIGGSGLYDLPGLEGVERITVETPYGSPSDALVTGRLHGKRMVFLPRHGVGHRILPTEINYRANIWALKTLGVSQLLSISAVGSMKESIVPGHLVFVDQFIDLTKRRVSTFFGEGAVAHVPMADPVCHGMRKLLVQVAKSAGIVHHEKGTYVCIEGPQFSTRAESRLYRTWGVSVIGMTAMPEAKLAREAELPFATLALATDYDCWHDTHDAVTVEQVMQTMKGNVILAKETLVALSGILPDPAKSVAHRAARGAVMTSPAAVTPEGRARLSWLLDL